MTPSPLNFYEDLAEYFHLIFEDWNASIDRQATALDTVLRSENFAPGANLLDCACGIGTQALGFAMSGYRVVGSDISRTAVARAKTEAGRRGLEIEFHIADMTSLEEIPRDDFDVVAAMDNALPHLTASQVMGAMRAIGSKLKRGGLFVASIRDYDRLIKERPTVQGPAFYGVEGERRIVHQIWEWAGQDRYRVHMYITLQAGEQWAAHHFVTDYYCLLRSELTAALESAGFIKVRWLWPEESGFYQPVVLARKG